MVWEYGAVFFPSSRGQHSRKTFIELYRKMNYLKKIRSLQNLVYGKAFLSHWTSPCENAQLFVRHLDGLGLCKRKKKQVPHEIVQIQLKCPMLFTTCQ